MVSPFVQDFRGRLARDLRWIRCRLHRLYVTEIGTVNLDSYSERRLIERKRTPFVDAWEASGLC